MGRVRGWRGRWGSRAFRRTSLIQRMALACELAGGSTKVLLVEDSGNTRMDDRAVPTSRQKRSSDGRARSALSSRALCRRLRRSRFRRYSCSGGSLSMRKGLQVWLHLPSSVFALEEEASTSDSDSLFRTLERSATWKTKSRPAASWSRTWRTARWTTRLFGQTYDHSMRQRGVESWISSLAATRVSRSATQASASALTIPATSGPRLNESFEMFSQSGASSRTSALICDLDSTKSPEAFKIWATRLRQACLQRRKSARLTDVSGCSSWPTARASYNENRNTQPAPSHGVTHGKTLAGEASAWWGTPTSRDWKDGASPSMEAPTNGLLGRQAPRTAMPGDESSPADQTSRRRLNPRFVEWLMGWPDGWVEPTSFTSSATE